MVHREDVDLVGRTLLVRKGKSQREQALMRRILVSPHPLADLRERLLEQEAGPLFPDLNDPSVPMKSLRNQTRYVTEGWAVATDGGEARK